MSVRNGRAPYGQLTFDAYRPHVREDTPALKLTDQPAAGSDVTLAVEPQIVAADVSLLVTAVTSDLPDGTTVDTSWESRVEQFGRRVLANPVWFDSADAERAALRWLGLYGRPLLRPKKIVVRPDAQRVEPGGTHSALGARIGDRADLVFQQTAGGGAALDEQFVVTGVDWRIWPLDEYGSAVELTYDLLPVTDIERWILGLSELGAHTVGRTMNRTVPWPGEPSGGDPVRARAWTDEGQGRNVYGADFDRLLRRRAIARYPDPAAMRAAETDPLTGQMAVTTDGSRHRLWAFDPGQGEFVHVASA